MSRAQLDWITEINDRPNVTPHAAIIGPSGSGKSTLVLAALGEWLDRTADAQLVICTPKSAADDPWGGFPAVRSGFDADTMEPSYAPIAAAILAVYHEVNLRNANPDRPRTPIRLVIDELTTTLDELRSIEPQRKIIRMILMGRSVGVRVVLLDPTMNVKGWGFEGRGDVRESLLFVRCNRDKSAQFFEWDAARNTAINVRAFDSSSVPALARRGLDPARVWVPETAPLAPPAGSAQHHEPTSDTATEHETALIRQWFAAGASRRECARRLYRARGGAQADYDGTGGAFYAVQAVVNEEP